MKRVGFYVIVICMVFLTTICVSANDSVPSGLLQVIGVYDSGDLLIDEDAVITRASFIQKINRLVRYDGLNIEEKSPSFTDVPITHLYYQDIVDAGKTGIIMPDKSGKFYPDKPLMYDDALVFLLQAMGYGDFVGENGKIDYIGAAVMAQNAGVSLRISNTAMTWEMQTNLLLKALEAHRMGYGRFDDGTASAYPHILLEEYNIGYVDGIVYADDKISLGTVKAPKGQIIIDGTSYFCSLADTKVGYHVRCYYMDGDPYREVMYLFPKRNDEVCFENKDIVSLTDDLVIAYGENGKKEKHTISRNASILFNGTLTDMRTVSSDPKYTFTGCTYLVDNDGDGKYDVCKINSYTNLYVEGLDSIQKIVYGKGGHSIKIGEYNNFYIYDEHNKEVDFRSIARSDVLSAYEPLTYDEPLIIHISRAVSEVIVSELDSEEIVLDSSGRQYDISKSAQVEMKDFSVQNEYILYLDYFGEIVYAEEISTLLKPVYLIDADQPESGFDTCKVKVLTDTGAISILRLDEMVTVRKSNGIIVQMSDKELLAIFKPADKAKRQLLLCRKDAEDKIKEIWFPATSSDIKFHEHIIPNAIDRASLGGKGWHYLSAPRSFSSVYILDPDAIVFLVPTADAEDVKDSQFSTGRTGTFVNNGGYPITEYFPEFYAMKENTYSASIVVWASQVASGGDIQTEPMIVTNITNAIDPDTEEEGKNIQMVDFGGNEKTVFYAYTEFAELLDAKGKKISKGDVVRYETDSDGNTRADMIVQDYSYVNKVINRGCSNNIQYRQDYDRITTFEVKELRNGIARSEIVYGLKADGKADEIFDLSSCVVFELELSSKKVSILSPLDVRVGHKPIARINGGVVRGLVYIKE